MAFLHSERLITSSNEVLNMTARNSTRAKSARPVQSPPVSQLATVAVTASDGRQAPNESLGDLLNDIHDRLSQAHATLDLLATMTSDDACAGEYLEGLCHHTFEYAVNGTMRQGLRG
jgi:hypothetical protein